MDALDRQRMKQSPALRAQAYHGSLPTFTLRCSAALRPTPELYSRTPLSGERGDAAREAELLPCLTVTIVHGPGHSCAVCAAAPGQHRDVPGFSFRKWTMCARTVEKQFA
ncbi:MAG: hypothetical protein ACLRXA_21915 [Clostridium sp.]